MKNKLVFELYCLKTENLNIVITVSIDSKIIIYGCEYGSIIKEITGDFDYEYYLEINKINTIKFKLLKRLTSFDDLKDFFIKKFSGEDGVQKIKRFCSRNFIRYKFNVWR
ncbi:hypothetical protein [uncultured Chryseobacterium sp.]|uniref:hypothetical protein n=1 Tax=uncultured Chryseobacterium sp. TaxID=259322 RepID=UPI0025DA0DF9|nr:hypothetical protein [uncultured Chryseobacterium sp.]